MLNVIKSYIYSSTNPEEENAIQQERNVEDKHAKQFDPKEALQRALVVHKTNGSFIFENSDHDASKIVKIDLGEHVPEAFMLLNVLTDEECQKFIDVTESLGYTDAPITTGMTTAQMMKDIRDNSRVMWQANPEMLDVIFQRVKAHLPATLINGDITKMWHLKGLNERLRFYRYHKNEQFAPHFDGCFRWNTRDQTHYTFIIYLNDGFEGGETTFFPGNINSMWTTKFQRPEYKVNPKRGAALVFRHTGTNSPYHEGSPHTTDGKCKYALRSDVAYTLTPPEQTQPAQQQSNEN